MGLYQAIAVEEQAVAGSERGFAYSGYPMHEVDAHPQAVQVLRLFKEVWHYKFVPESNLVDVHMGRLRRKIDGPDDAPMIRSVRGAGFVLSATPLAPGLPAGPAERSTSLPAAAKSTRATNATCSGHR